MFFIFNNSSLLLAHYTLRFTQSSQVQYAVDSDVVKGKIKNELTQLDIVWNLCLKVGICFIEFSEIRVEPLS